MTWQLLDLGCGAGGASEGYHRAGFQVTGVDLAPQPHYPFAFHQGDMLTWPLDGFAVVHASPPCQLWSRMHRLTQASHLDLITPVRDRLLAAGVPYVIENVEGAPLHQPWVLCGTQFGLPTRRHRLFEVWPPVFGLMPACTCAGGVAQGRLVGHRIRGRENRGRMQPPPWSENARKWAYGVPWMTYREARQAIPPPYTEFIGKLLLAELGQVAS